MMMFLVDEHTVGIFVVFETKTLVATIEITIILLMVKVISIFSILKLGLI